jgi:hypothetical protein
MGNKRNPAETAAKCERCGEGKEAAGNLSREQVYVRDIAPRIDMILAICRAHGIPMFAAVEVRREQFYLSLSRVDGMAAQFGLAEAMFRDQESNGLIQE